jgi:integration host factor subunit beta
MATTTKKDLIDWIANETGQKRTTVKRTVQCFLDRVIDELRRGNRLEFRDFGVFEIRDRAPRVAQNPKTLERVPVPAKRTVKFKVGRLMKVALEDHAGEDAAGRPDGAVPRPARVPVASGASGP